MVVGTLGMEKNERIEFSLGRCVTRSKKHPSRWGNMPRENFLEFKLTGCWAGLDLSLLPQELWHGFSVIWESSIWKRNLHYPGNRTQDLLLTEKIWCNEVQAVKPPWLHRICRSRCWILPWHKDSATLISEAHVWSIWFDGCVTVNAFLLDRSRSQEDFTWLHHRDITFLFAIMKHLNVPHQIRPCCEHCTTLLGLATVT